ncbi:hypothetical protein LCGC14_2138190 [marine sediment metagenome]|uniref:Uncharacterized protein n=1 Tax=marine sediment metagenome TaxID=412755 RepID=A0A0F9DZ83_9ZZZZ
MAKGKAIVVIPRQQGYVSHETAGEWDFIYRASTVKDAAYDIGDHVKLADGREFVYSKSSGVVASGQAAQFVATGAIPYVVLDKAQSEGDKEITFAAVTHSAIAKDELRGGFIVLWGVALKDMTRGIIGNGASVANASIKIYLDGPLTRDVTTSTPGEAYENPYANLINTGGGSSTLAKAGIAATYVSAADMYFWVQKSGFVFIAPQSDMITNKIGGYFRHDGSIQADQAFSSLQAGNDTTQYAGHRVIGDYNNNGPLFNLQG